MAKAKAEPKKVKDPKEGFVDVSNRYSLTYVLDNGVRLEVYNPLWLKICESGAHKIVDADGTGIYVHPEKNWYTHWTMKDGSFPFTF